MNLVAKKLQIKGRVQGVCYRESLRKQALKENLVGWVRNRKEGSVEAFLQGASESVENAIAWCYQGPPLAKVSSIEAEDVPVDSTLFGFDRLATE